MLGDIYYGEIILPDVIHVAAGREMNLWWNTAAVWEEGDSSVYFEVKCDIGKTTARGFLLKADESMIGTHSLTIRSRELHTRKILCERTVSLCVADASAGCGSKNILMIGDSRTLHTSDGVQGEYRTDKITKTTTSEIKKLLDSTQGAKFNFAGTFVSAADPEVRNLADNGWCYSTAISTIEAAGGIVPYIEKDCGLGEGASLDFVSIMYGINDLADWHVNNLDQYERSCEKIPAIVDNAKKLVDMITAGYPGCRIILVLESSVAGNQDGFAYWGGTDNDCAVEWEFAVKALRKKIIETFDGGRYSENVTLSAAGLWCDRTYGYPYVTSPVSERTDEAKAMRLVNCVHPHDNGYRQIADGDFSTLKYLLSIE